MIPVDYDTLFWLLAGFQLKHLAADFFFQFPCMYRNKGIYLHRGGIDHAALHGLFTGIVLSLVMWNTLTYPFLFFAVVFDAVTHYHIDWAKVNICKKFKWGPETSDHFWEMTGVDQYLHQLVYIILIVTGLTLSGS